jgi:hypothetical protein
MSKNLGYSHENISLKSKNNTSIRVSQYSAVRNKTTLKGENASMVIQTLKAEHASFIQ